MPPPDCEETLVSRPPRLIGASLTVAALLAAGACAGSGTGSEAGAATGEATRCAAP
ncbi:hypothetical protein [Geodermatophilus maliterrae]|uniref:Uncharacterized protein n=1 Tax=Geodermatophilus maliterrae TaxID=3162531 RepID=A0ABV3XBF9_9ACTN